MKTINYTGSSKLISRIVNLLNRKAPMPLDADGDAVWGTSGQVLTTDGSVDPESPSSINIYASTFADKDKIADLIQQY